MTLLVPSDMKNNMLYPSEISFLSSLVGKRLQLLFASFMSFDYITQMLLMRGTGNKENKRIVLFLLSILLLTASRKPDYTIA